jgi:DNA-binding HxlR family transcriptional regulator
MTQFEDMCAIRGDAGRTVRAIVDRIGDKWTLMVVATLNGGRLRYSELKSRIPGVSQRMLSLTLRNLERDGLVSRTAYAEVPPRVEYALTEVGESFTGPAMAIANWAVEHNPSIESKRAEYDARA